MRRDEPAMGSPRRPLGLAGRTALSALLGPAAAGWELEGAASWGRAVEFSLTRGPRRLAFALVPELRGGVARADLRSRGRSEDLSPDEAAMRDALAAVVRAEAWAGLASRLRRDELLYADPEGGRAPSRLDRYYRVNDRRGDEWRFVHPRWRCLEEKVLLGARWARINYSTLECRLSNPNPEVPCLRLFADEALERDGDGCRNVEAVMTEAEVVGGLTQRRLGAELERVAREDAPQFIHLNTTCMPELLGDTPVPFLSRVEGGLGVPVFWTSKTRAGGPLYASWIERMLAAVPTRARDPRAVLLAGVPSPAAGEEARALLAAAGLRVVGAVLPGMDLKAAPEAGAASGVVWLDPVGWESVGDEGFLRRGLAVVRTHPPYGLAGTRAWLERVGGVLGLPDAGAAADAAAAARAAELESVRGRARGKVVALAGDADDLGLLTARGRALGFSVAALLGELGFSTMCLVRARGAAERRARRRAPVPSGAGTIEFSPFATEAELARGLARADLAFTHLNHDPRLRAAGLLGFTEAAFETGVDGLLRAGRRLLDRAAARPFPGRRTR